jgi:thioredoxin reductase (NADPH)
VFGTPYDGSLEIEDNVVKTHLVLPYDYIIVQYGYKIINTPSFNKKIKILNNKIVVNKKQETSMKNIYACGDCCHYDKKTYTIKDGFDEVDKILKI